MKVPTLIKICFIFQYLQAQQQVEEMKRQIDLIEFDNKQVSDQIQIEIQKMKVGKHFSDSEKCE